MPHGMGRTPVRSNLGEPISMRTVSLSNPPVGCNSFGKKLTGGGGIDFVV
jgi:hypothetical protein